MPANDPGVPPPPTTPKHTQNHNFAFLICFLSVDRNQGATCKVADRESQCLGSETPQPLQSFG